MEPKNDLSPTLQKLQNYAEEIMSRGGPANKQELEAMMIYNRWKGGTAFNAGRKKDTYIKKAKNK